MEKYGTAGGDIDMNIIQRLRIAGWITNATDPHSEYVILTAFPGNNGYANAPHCYVIVHCLSFSELIFMAFLSPSKPIPEY